MNKIIKASGTSHNRTVYAAPPVGGLASIRLGHGYAIPTPHSGTFGRHANLRFALLCHPNVVNSRNVMRNARRMVYKNKPKDIVKINVKKVYGI
jgi:hypothetical protein